MPETKTLAVRLALRQEGHFWCAYIAPEHTMDGAKLIGTIALGAVQKNALVRDTFMNLMQTVLGDAVLAVTGQEPDHWLTRDAPESERSGNA